MRKERGFLAVVDGWINGVKSNVLQVFTGLALGTIRDYIFRLDKMAEKLFAIMDAEGKFKVGGEGIIVETDECLVKQGKEDVWVVGVLEREVRDDGEGAAARKAAFMITRRRDEDTLVGFIWGRVEEGSVLISDCWRGYTDLLDDHSRTHGEHSVEYGYTAVVGDVTIPINTNHIEREWVEVRKALKHRRFSTYRNVLMRESYRLWILKG